MKYRTSILAPLLCLLILLPILAQAQTLYRWVDDRGEVHYGQVPPAGAQAEQIRRASPPSDRAAQERLERAMGDSQERQDAQRNAAAEQGRQAESERIRRENCTQARSNLETLTARGGRVTIREDGAYRVLEEEERQRMLEETQAQIREYCGDDAR